MPPLFKTKIKLFLFLYLIPGCCIIFAQKNAKADSLINLLNIEKNDSIKIELLNKIADAYSMTESKLSEKYLKQALEYASKRGNKKQLAETYNNYGSFYYYQSDYPSTLSALLKTLKLYEELKDSIKITETLDNIGLVYESNNQLDLAKSYFLRDIEYQKKNNLNESLIISYTNLSQIYNLIYQKDGLDSNFNASNKYSDLAINLLQKTLDKDPNNTKTQNLIIINLNNRGDLLTIRGKKTGNYAYFKEALYYHEKQIEYSKKNDEQYFLGVAYINIGNIYRAQQQYKKSLDKYQEALTIIKKINFPEELKEIYEGMAINYEAMRDYENGFKYIKLFEAIEDSIFNEVKSKQIDDLELKYQAEKKQKEIELLNTEQAISNAKLIKWKTERNNILIWIFAIIIVTILTISLLLVVWNRSRLKTKSNEMLLQQNKLINLKNKEITDSIKYAKLIQEAVLSHESDVKKLIPSSFLLYKPKDIVSGDFFWIEEWNNTIVYAVADCTGHGVPGAFMSIVGNNLLFQAVNVFGLYKPSLILNYLNKNTAAVLNKTLEQTTLKDGMDISLIMIDKKLKKLEFSGAYNDLWIVRNNNLIEFKSDKISVGSYIQNEKKEFTSHEFDLEIGDMIYMFTDGYADQFGGLDEKSRETGGKKFKYSKLKELLLSISKKDLNTQYEIISKTHENWRGHLEQLDDICIAGIYIGENFFSDSV